MKQIYAYHIKPPNFIGDKILPLTLLKDVSLDLYEKALKKYTGREDVMNTIIVNNLKWTNVSFFTLHNPKQIIEKLRSLGFEFPKMEVFKIPIERFDDSSVIWLYSKAIETDRIEKNELINIKEYKKIDSETIPKKTLEYFYECGELKKKPLLFAYIPHLLTSVPVNIKDVEIFEI